MANAATAISVASPSVANSHNQIRTASFDIEEPAATISSAADFSYYSIFGRVRAHPYLLSIEKPYRPVEETGLLMSSPAMVVLSGSRMEEAPR